MNVIRENIIDSLQGTSIILVFVTTFFSSRYPDAMRIIKEDIPEGPIAIRDYEKQIKTSLCSNCIIPLLLSILVLVFCVPLVIEVFRSGQFRLWSLDPLPAIFVLVAAWLLLMVIIWAKLACKTYKKLISVKEKSKRHN